jgi:tRNA1(Val) A37 N6-methylase TrmN6
MNLETTDDRLLDGRVIVRQPVKGYRAAVDPVLLAAAVRAKPGQKVLDAGCGTGAAMFCLLARVSGLAVTGLEIQQNHAVLAGQGIALNKFNETFIAVGDITRPPPDMLNAFDIVLTNPPYGDAGTPPPNESLAVAHMEGEADLKAWIRGCLSCLRPKGRLVMIHRADRLSDILAAMHQGAGDIRILPILSKSNQPARRVIVDAGKERLSPDTLLPGLVLHEDSGAYTSAADAILRHGGPLFTP